MNLNDWKVLYSNTTETRAKCMPWLWENVDAGWSFWYCDYKFDDELTNPLFMTSNLVSGYFAVCSLQENNLSFLLVCLFVYLYVSLQIWCDIIFIFPCSMHLDIDDFFFIIAS